MERSLLFQKIQEVLSRRKIVRASIYGSFARNEETDHSDIDILVETAGHTFFDILRLEDELQNVTNRKIDIVEYRSVKKSIEKQVFSHLIPLL